MSETKDSSFYSKKNSERPLVTRNLSDISENTPYKQQRVEPSPSVTSQKSLSEKLLDIDSIHKNSSRHVLRPAIPIEQAPAPAPQIRKSSGISNFMTYQGKTKHCCKGRCLFGSQPKWSTFSFFMFNLPALLTYVFVSPCNIIMFLAICGRRDLMGPHPRSTHPSGLHYYLFLPHSLVEPRHHSTFDPSSSYTTKSRINAWQASGIPRASIDQRN